MRRIVSIIMLIGLICGVGYVGVCVYANVTQSEGVDLPDISEAGYSLIIKNTATVILTNDYEVFGGEVGNRHYQLSGYWELVDGDFKYREDSIVLSQEIFGEIILKRR